LKKHILMIIGGVGAAAVLTGCGGGAAPVADTSSSTAAITPKPDNFVANVDAGNPDNWPKSAPPMDLATMKTLVASRSLPSRTDPFALHKEERAFETKQAGARIFQETGGNFALEYVPPPELDTRPVFEEQPYRRLAGVIVGDSVLAIIEMGNGQPPQIIRPGERIPNSEWTVVSINEDRAILRRSGNKLPKEITVRLESVPFNQQGGGTGGAPSGTGGGTGGGPGTQGGPPQGNGPRSGGNGNLGGPGG